MSLAPALPSDPTAAMLAALAPAPPPPAGAGPFTDWTPKWKKGGDYELNDAEKEDLLKQMWSDHKEGWTHQAEYRRRAMKLEDYVAGRQIWDSQNNRYVGHEIAGAPDASGDVDQEKMVFNRMKRVHLSNVQRLSGYQISPVVVPKSTRPDDKEGARLGRVALTDMFDRMGEPKFRRRVATIISKYGTVFFKTHFDPTRGRLVHPLKEDEITGEAVYDQSVLVAEGEVVIEAVSPRNVLLPRYTRELRLADRLTEVHMESTDWVWRNYGVKVDSEPLKARTWTEPTAVDTDMREVEWPLYAPEHSCQVNCSWIRPCPAFQRGAIIVFTNKHILRCTDLLTWYDDIPWDIATAIEDEKSALGESWLWDLIPLQDSENTILSGVTNHIKVYGDMQYQFDTNSNIEVGKLDNATGHGYQYTGNGAQNSGIEPITWPDIPKGHYTSFSLIDSLLQSLGAAQDIQRSPKVQSGNALATLQQIDDTVLKPVLESIESGLESACGRALKQMGSLYGDPRLIKMSGQKGWQVVEGFTGAMLNENYDVKVKLMTGLSNNPIVRQEQIAKMIQMGIITPQQAAKYLEFGDTDSMMEDLQKQDEIAEGNLKQITDPANYSPNPANPGDVISKFTPMSFDDAALMAEKLTNYMRENFRSETHMVQIGLQKALMFYLKMATPKPPTGPLPGPGAGPQAGGGMAPTATGLPGSPQNPADQPPPGSVPSPAFTGLAQAPGAS